MPDCLASDQSGTRMKKLTMPGQVQYQTKPSQSCIFLVLYRTKIIDAVMPMPALVFWMPMLSYAYIQGVIWIKCAGQNKFNTHHIKIDYFRLFLALVTTNVDTLLAIF